MISKLKQTDNLAIVIGGSISGLIAARVLSDRFDRVVIIESDRLPSKPIFRQGVPQSLQVHALLTKGKEILEQFFPGLIEDLVKAGAKEIDVIGDWRYLFADGWAPSFASGIIIPTCSRSLLENTIRKQLNNYKNIEFLEAHQVTGLTLDRDFCQITGVTLKNQQNQELKMSAQFVADASGRNSQTPKWLENLGYSKPQQTVINSFLGYATRWYEKPSEFRTDWQAINLMSKPQDCQRSGMLYPVENETWIVTLAGIGKDYPPTDEKSFHEFARSLRSKEIYDAIVRAKPISPIYSYRGTENRFRHYEKLERFPENFIVMGDAVCSFNPIYGQGMTAAALAGLTLADCLKQQKVSQSNPNLLGLSRRFQKKLAQINQTPWLMATSDDLRWPTTVGAQPDLQMRLMHKYLETVIGTACHNNYVHQRFIEVAHLLKSPTTLFTPDIFFRVLYRTLSPT